LARPTRPCGSPKSRPGPPVPLDSRPESGPRSERSRGRDRSPFGGSGAEGATAPETLRQTDREDIRTLESRSPFMGFMGAPTEQAGNRGISQASGQRGREDGGAFRPSTRL
jgi:hypothetical protein